MRNYSKIFPAGLTLYISHTSFLCFVLSGCWPWLASCSVKYCVDVKEEEMRVREDDAGAECKGIVVVMTSQSHIHY